MFLVFSGLRDSVLSDTLGLLDAGVHVYVSMFVPHGYFPLSLVWSVGSFLVVSLSLVSFTVWMVACASLWLYACVV